MAQRTGAKRFLAPPAKSASAGVSLALALAALLFSGCGGSSGSEQDRAAGATISAATAARHGTDAGATEGESFGKAGGANAKAKKVAGTHSAAEGETEQSRKRGPHVALPEGPPEEAPSPKEVANATVADMHLESPEVVAQGGNPGALPASFTCDGKDSWPELRWTGVPAGTAELALYAMSVQPVDGQLFVDWAVAGLDPGLSGIQAGELPKGAVVGTNGFGKRNYEICPEGAEIYMFAVYALPTALSPPRGFDARELRRRILDVSGNVGLLPAVFARG